MQNVQWAYYQKLNPLFDRQFITHSYGCRVGKGTTKAREQLQTWLRKASRSSKKWYVLKLDIAKYFYRVDHEVLQDFRRGNVCFAKRFYALPASFRSRSLLCVSHRKFSIASQTGKFTDFSQCMKGKGIYPRSGEARRIDAAINAVSTELEAGQG